MLVRRRVMSMVRAVSSAEKASLDSPPARPMEVEPRHGEAGPRRRARRSLMSRRCDPDRPLSAGREERRQAVQRLPSIHSAEGQVVRSPCQLEVAHLDVADLVGVEVHLGHLQEDEVEELGAVEAADLGVEVELLDDVAVSASKAAIQARRLPATWRGSARMARRFRRSRRSGSEDPSLRYLGRGRHIGVP